MYQYFQQRLTKDIALERKWKEMFKEWSQSKPDLYKVFMQMAEKKLPEHLEQELVKVDVKSPMATRSSSQVVLNALGEMLPQLYGALPTFPLPI